MVCGDFLTENYRLELRTSGTLEEKGHFDKAISNHLILLLLPSNFAITEVCSISTSTCIHGKLSMSLNFLQLAGRLG